MILFFRDTDDYVCVKQGVIEVTFHEDSDGFISLVGRPLMRPRTNSLASSKIREDVSSACVTASATTSMELLPEEKPTDQSFHEYGCHEAAAGRGRRSAEMHLTFLRAVVTYKSFVCMHLAVYK